jgi:peptidyl-prolyl cis-trans isomerase SurA
MRRIVKRALAASFVLGLAAFGARDARAVIVERVVAVIGERPILLSELQYRARPYLHRIYAGATNEAQVAAAKTEIEKELLSKMIDERIMESAADKAHLNVSAEEVDNAMRNVANQAHLTLPQLLEAVRHQEGLTESQYREELRRQITEGKLMQLRVRGRVRVTESDARAVYQRYVADLEKQNPVNLRLLAKHIKPGATAEEVRQLSLLANRLVDRARRGEDFCKLVREFSDDTVTRGKCGERGDQPLAALYPEVQAAVKDLKVGDVTEPIPIGTEAILVVQVGPPRAPAFEEVKDEMFSRAYEEAMERQSKQWLDEQKHGVYIDVRL